MMNEMELCRLREIRSCLDRTYMNIYDADAYIERNVALLHAIAEYLIRPLQEHEYAERTKLPNQGNK